MKVTFYQNTPGCGRWVLRGDCSPVMNCCLVVPKGLIPSVGSILTRHPRGLLGVVLILAMLGTFAQKAIIVGDGIKLQPSSPPPYSYLFSDLKERLMHALWVQND